MGTKNVWDHWSSKCKFGHLIRRSMINTVSCLWVLPSNAYVRAERKLALPVMWGETGYHVSVTELM
jgi:hypothetical protein